MKILAASRHPASAEVIAPLVRALRALNHNVLLVGVDNKTPETHHVGGSAAIFHKNVLHFKTLDDLGYDADPLCMPVTWAVNLINDFEPHLVLVGASHDPTGLDLGVEDVLIAGAAKEKIRSVQVIDTFGTWFPRAKQIHPSVYTVGNDYEQKVLVSRGAPEDRVFVVGQPSYDEYAELTLSKQNLAIKEKFGLVGCRVLAFFSQGEPGNRQVLSWILNALSEQDRLIIAPHPRDNESYADLTRSVQSLIVPLQWKNEELLDWVDVCLTRYSTMGMKAVLKGLPTVNVLPEDDWKDIRQICGGFPLALAGGSVEVHSQEALSNQLVSVPRPDVMSVKKWFHIDGQSTKRLVDFVLGGVVVK